MDLTNLIGFILPPFIDLINTRVANSIVRFWISMLFCVAVGVIINLEKIKNPEEFLGSIALVFATAQITYKTYWEKSAPRQELQKRL